MKGLILLAAVAALSGCSTDVVRPVEADQPPSQVVSFDDLDLGNPADSRVLHERIRTAAVQVCGPVRAHDVAQFWIRPCIQRAVTRAVADVDSRRAK